MFKVLLIFLMTNNFISYLKKRKMFQKGTAAVLNIHYNHSQQANLMKLPMNIIFFYKNCTESCKSFKIKPPRDKTLVVL